MTRHYEHFKWDFQWIFRQWYCGICLLTQKVIWYWYYIIRCSFLLFLAAPMAYGSSWARNWTCNCNSSCILNHTFSNFGSLTHSAIGDLPRSSYRYIVKLLNWRSYCDLSFFLICVRSHGINWFYRWRNWVSDNPLISRLFCDRARVQSHAIWLSAYCNFPFHYAFFRNMKG